MQLFFKRGFHAQLKSPEAEVFFQSLLVKQYLAQSEKDKTGESRGLTGS